MEHGVPVLGLRMHRVCTQRWRRQNVGRHRRRRVASCLKHHMGITRSLIQLFRGQEWRLPLSFEQYHANTQGCRGGQWLLRGGRGKGRARAASLKLISGGGASRSDPPMGRRRCGRRTSSVRSSACATRVPRVLDARHRLRILTTRLTLEVTAQGLHEAPHQQTTCLVTMSSKKTGRRLWKLPSKRLCRGSSRNGKICPLLRHVRLY